MTKSLYAVEKSIGERSPCVNGLRFLSHLVELFSYHVLTRGNNRRHIFKVEEDYGKYIDLVRGYKEKLGNL